MKYLITKYDEVFEISETQRENFTFNLTLLNDMFQIAGVVLHYSQTEIDDDIEYGSILIDGLDNVKEFLYQRRLDNILKKMKIKFKGTKDEYYYYELKLGEYIVYGEIYYWENQFRLLANGFILSLKTVENLFKDLKA